MALWNNFPYVDLHELNLDYLIKKLKELQAEWEAISGKVKATATTGDTAGVTVEGNLKDGLSFDFTLPPGAIATPSQVGVVKPDDSTIFISPTGIITSQLSGIAARQTTGSGEIENPNTFTKILLNRATESFGDGSILQVTEDNGVRVNESGTYLVEGSTWVTPYASLASNVQLRVTQGIDYASASPIAWGITSFDPDRFQESLPVNTSMRVITADAGDIFYMDVAIAAANGRYLYANRETQLTIVKLAPKTWQ